MQGTCRFYLKLILNSDQFPTSEKPAKCLICKIVRYVTDRYGSARANDHNPLLDSLAATSRRKRRQTSEGVAWRRRRRLSRLQGRASSFRAHGLLYNHFDREKMGDHVSAVAIVMLVRLDGPVGIFGTREQGIAPRLLWRQPIEFPTSPCMFEPA